MTNRALTAILMMMICCMGRLVAGQSGYHVDEERGFKLKPPAKWDQIPVDPSEKWIVTKYLSNRAFISNTGLFSFEHRPYLRVIVFPDEAVKKSGLDVSVSGNSIFVGFNNPHKDYRDYLKNTRKGFYFSKEETGKNRGLDYEEYEARFEHDSANYRLVCWVFRAADAAFAVEFEILDEHFDKLYPLARSALRSFRFIERRGQLVAGTTESPGGPKKLDDDDLAEMGDRDKWRELSAAERKKRRQAVEDRVITRFVDTAPDDWIVKKSKNCVVISHADEKYTQSVVEAADACRSFLDKHLSDLSDEYVTRSVIRLCRDYPEYRAYLDGGSGFSIAANTNVREVVLYKDLSGGKRSGLGWLFDRLTSDYLRDKDRLLAFGIPEWMSSGLSSTMSSAKPKGRSIELEPDTWENDAVRDLVRQGKTKSAKDLMTMTSKEFYGDYTDHSYLSTRLVRYILTTGARRAPFKGFLLEYLAAVIEATEEVDAATEAKAPAAAKTAQTEEEEEAQYKQARQNDGKRQKDILALIESKLGWSSREWAAVEKAYASALD
ncbi:MAG: hypothetical protein KDB53_10415 [Planctomycetes bacterium]|nr:hypothetical protein [Planctomycetota bacterium]